MEGGLSGRREWNKENAEWEKEKEKHPIGVLRQRQKEMMIRRTGKGRRRTSLMIRRIGKGRRKT